MEARELPLVTGNFDLQSNTHMNKNFTSSIPTKHNPHKRYRNNEQSKVADPLESHLCQQCVSANSELSELIDPYYFGSRMPDMLDADGFKKIQDEQWAENLYSKQSGFESDSLDNLSWPTTPSPRIDTSIAQHDPPNTCREEQGIDGNKNNVHASDVEKCNSKRRKRSTSPDHTEREDEEQRRIRHIVKDLEKFEYQQMMYGKQQLKAIRDGIA